MSPTFCSLSRYQPRYRSGQRVFFQPPATVQQPRPEPTLGIVSTIQQGSSHELYHVRTAHGVYVLTPSVMRPYDAAMVGEWMALVERYYHDRVKASCQDFRDRLAKAASERPLTEYHVQVHQIDRC